MFPINLNFKLFAVTGIAAMTVGFGAGWHVKTKFVEAAKAKELVAQIEQQTAEQEEANAAATAWEKQLLELRETNRKLNRRLKNEIASNRIYSECVVPASGVRALSSAVSGDNSAAESDE